MSEEPRPQPNLDRVREAMREHDEHKPDEAPPPPEPGDDDDDDEDA
jgi:hypothetical protein